MVPESEIVTFILGVGVIIFFLLNRNELKYIPASKTLFSGFGVFLVGWTSTIAESFILADFFNYLEHFSYAAGSILILIWCWLLFRNRETV